MDTKKMSLEDISAFVDGETTDDEADAIIAALRQDEAKDVWNVYHCIGDTLRSDDLAFTLRPDFTARLAARLEAEPTVMAPSAKPTRERAADVAARRGSRMLRRYAIPGAAAAAVAAALIGAPQWMASRKDEVAERGSAFVAASVPRIASAESTDVQGQMVAVKAQNGVILRDPRIDDYLLAHQRFSPSIYSTAQYARSAAFSTDSNK